LSGAGALARIATVCALLVGVAACDGDAKQPAPADSGADALRAVVAAEKSLVYTGYKRTIHGEEGVGRATRMKVSRSASGRTLLEWGDEGGQPTRRWAYRSRFAWLDDPGLLLRNYSVEVDPADGPAVAWRDTRHLTIRARRPGRPSLDLLVDKETSLVLREQVRDFDGKLWLTNVFDTIDYRAPDEAAADDASAEPLAEAGAADGSAQMPLRVTAPPDGFVRIGGVRSECGGLREDWTDGVAAFSVIERTAGPAAAGVTEGELQRRACSGRAVVSGRFSGVDVTIAGNLPAAELETVARGLAAVRQ
jgi:hypothetical protein